MDEITNTTTEKEVVEIQDVETPKVTGAPSRDDLKAKGWSARELEAAEKRGMIPKKEKKEEEAPKETEKPEAKQPEKVDEKPKSSLPDFKISDPEKEKVFLETFGPGTPQRAMYFRMKEERRARQAAQAERDRILLETQILRDEINELKNGKKAQPEVDENGNEIDPDDKPLTAKQLKEMREREQEELDRKQREHQDKATRVESAIKEQEEMARNVYEDFDDVVSSAKEVIPVLDKVVDDPKVQRRAARLFQELQVAAANADKVGPDDFTAADIAYELGLLLRKYGTKANGQKPDNNDGKLERPEIKANGSLTPEQMKRMEANTQRRASSASIPGGGGKRVVSVDDITIKDVLKMNAEERQKFREKHPEKMKQLLRG